MANETKNTNLVPINIKLDATLYNKVKILSTILETKRNNKVHIYDVMNEAMALVIEKYAEDIKSQLELFNDLK
ncbi:hypothetical protein [Clostridium sulfidigenes]|uniref:hypothetical protein n=1 Tax=Clostridium sulfidigenes TaxID=318464 RepID=UPI003F8B2E62